MVIVRAVNILLEKLGEKYSTELGINLDKGESREVFKWFLASILFGARISENIAKTTYKEFEENDLLDPEKIIDAGWEKLVETMDSGGYTRYDFSTASALLEVMKKLRGEYGSLEKIHEQSKDSSDLENRLKEFKRVGPVTVNIFLRELRGIWVKADPVPSRIVLMAAKKLGLDTDLKKTWAENMVKGKDFRDFESALLRLGKDYCRKNKCKECPLSEYCKRL